MVGVAFHVDQLYYATPGGIGTYIRRLVPALAEVDPALRITLFHSRFAAASTATTVPVTGAPGAGAPEVPERWMRDLWTEELPAGIRSLYPSWALFGRPALPPSLAGHDLLHAPSPSAVPPPGPSQRLVVTVHDLAFVVQPEAFPARWRLMFRAGLRRAVRAASALITVSHSTAEDLVRHAGADPARVYVVPLAPALPASGVSVDDVLARYRIRSPYVLYNGTLDPRKNLPRLVRAYRRIASEGSAHVLVLAGPLGWRPSPLMDELAAPAPGNVVLTGRVPAADLDALYRGADAFAYPSLYEGFGIPVLDALERGLPCVIAASSSLPEVAGDAAVLVDPRSEAGIADGLRRVLDDGDLAARLRREGPRRAAMFSWQQTARRTLDVYHAVL